MSEPAVNSPSVLRPLPRRSREHFAVPERPPSRLIKAGLPPASTGLVLRRLLAWAGVGVSFYTRNTAGLLLGRDSMEHRARRLVDALPLTGRTGRVIAGLMSARHDLLPYPHCVALSSMGDEAPPQPLSQAMSEIEAAVGSPLSEIYAEIYPEPISSSVLDTTWQARLVDGRAVRIRVQRPGVMQRFSADVQAQAWVLSFTDFATVLPAYTVASIRQDVRELLLGDGDFAAQGRFHRVLQRWLKRERIRSVHCAGVHSALSSAEVLVVDELDGMPLSELARAVEAGDQLLLARYAKQGIDPQRVARRLLALSWWEMFENLFVHVPRMADLVVHPGGVIGLQRLRGPGFAGSRQRRMYRLAMRHLARNDVGGAVDALVQMVSPLPHIDVYSFGRALERRVGRCLLALSDPASPWPERTTAPLWVGVLETAREFGVALNPEPLRLARASMAFHTMAVRLAPEMDLLKRYARYERSADRRAHRRFRKEMERVEEAGRDAALIARLSEASDQLERVSFFVDAVTATPPVQYLSLAGKVSYAASVLLNVVLGLASVALVITAITTTWGLLGGRPPEVLDALNTAVWNPVFLVFATLAGFLAVRRIHTRLLDRDED